MKYTPYLFLALLIWSCNTTKPCCDHNNTGSRVENNKTLPYVDSHNTGARVAITHVLQQQQDSWNEGDIEGFMKGYWQSDSLMFIGSRGVTLGWQNTLDNYKRGYPTNEKMGRLEFEVIHLDKVTEDSYFMMGKYTLIRKTDKPTGYFVLLWKLIKGKWLIVSDHTVS